MKKILVPIDDADHSLRALEYAGIVASVFKAEVVALHLIDPKLFKSKKDFHLALNNFVDEQVRPKFKKAIQSNPAMTKIRLETRALQSEISEHILEFKDELEADFIVMSSQGLRSRDEWELRFQNTNAYKVILKSDVPVFSFTQLPEQVSIRHILVPIDDSEGSLLKIPYAVKIARNLKASITLFSAVSSEKDKNTTDSTHSRLLDELQIHNLQITSEIKFADELPETMMKFGEEIKADLFIIMNRPSNRWSDFFITPGAKKIISFSKIPVLSLPGNVNDNL